jgi:hypothetical protein
MPFLKRNNAAKGQTKQTTGHDVLGAIFKESVAEVTAQLQQGDKHKLSITLKDSMTRWRTG